MSRPYPAFYFALLAALLFPSEIILSSALVVWGYLGAAYPLSNEL